MPTSATLKLGAVAGLLAVGTAAAFAYHEVRLDLEQRQTAVALFGGNPENAHGLIVRYGCAGCHQIKGIPEATGQAGPSLSGVARQHWRAGIMEADVENTIGWIVDPQRYDPRTAMPRTGITPEEARDVATYLYAIR